MIIDNEILNITLLITVLTMTGLSLGFILLKLQSE
nr:cytochrome b6-f complex subunit VII [Galdieria phlegrea]UNJ16198.1 cytochrome B6-f complex subunit [Galdieria sp.]WDA99560.1 cytochrome b6-f complex subunit VII [Galdieria sulphuraria]WDA99750.1 cytochrome b6-f complex subunit VII [Galdieria phlegrea]